MPALHSHSPHTIQDPELLRFVDLECFLWSTVPADLTPLINAGMVFCDRHYGGINYPVSKRCQTHQAERICCCFLSLSWWGCGL